MSRLACPGRATWTLCTLALCLPCVAAALTPLPGGDFESGTLSGWTAGGAAGGFAALAAEGNCFSGNDTSGIELAGNYAALVRAGRESGPESTGLLTSAPFEAGIGIAFSALTETFAGADLPAMPVDFRVRILGGDGSLLREVVLATSVAPLVDGCYMHPVGGAFSTHYVDTRPFTGRQVRVQFAQSSRVREAGLFTLVDDVVRLDAGDAQVLPDRPRAVAGFSRSAGGRLRLDGSLSSDPASLPLVHRWVLDGEAAPRDGEFPCIDDLEPGRYRATLVVDNGVHIDADALHFTIAPPPLAAAENGPVPSDAEVLHLAADVPLSMDCSDGADPAPEPEDEGEGEGAMDEEGEPNGEGTGSA